MMKRILIILAVIYTLACMIGAPIAGVLTKGTIWNPIFGFIWISPLVIVTLWFCIWVGIDILAMQRTNFDQADHAELAEPETR